MDSLIDAIDEAFKQADALAIHCLTVSLDRPMNQFLIRQKAQEVHDAIGKALAAFKQDPEVGDGD